MSSKFYRTALHAQIYRIANGLGDRQILMIPELKCEKNAGTTADFVKGTVRPDWICIRVVPLDRPWNGHQPLYVYDFLILILNIWIDFKVLSRFMQNCLQSSCMFGPRFAYLFHRTVLQKFGRDINCSSDYGTQVKNSSIPQSKPK